MRRRRSRAGMETSWRVKTRGAGSKAKAKLEREREREKGRRQFPRSDLESRASTTLLIPLGHKAKARTHVYKEPPLLRMELALSVPLSVCVFLALPFRALSSPISTTRHPRPRNRSLQHIPSALFHPVVHGVSPLPRSLVYAFQRLSIALTTWMTTPLLQPSA